MIIKNLVLLLFIAIIGSSASQSVSPRKNVTIRCQLIVRGFNCDEIRGLTLCDNNDLVVNDPGTYVENVAYRNGTEMAYFDTITVEALRIMNTNVNFIPKNISDYLPYLRALQMSDTNLIYVEKDDLEQFGERLQCLYLSRNKIISLSNNVFDANHNLIEIGFHTNPLKYIEREIFNDLWTLRQVHFTNCRDMNLWSQYRNFTIFDCIHGCNDMAAPERIKRYVAQKFQNSKLSKSNISQLSPRLQSTTNNEVSSDECLSYILQIQKQEEMIQNLQRQLEKALQKHLICDLPNKNSIKCDVHIDNDQANIGSIKFSSGEIKDMSQIKNLQVNNSSMNFLPTNVNEKLVNLEKLIVTSSKLMKVERRTLNMKNLKVLNLTDNLLTAIPYDAFLDVVNLEELILTKNRIVSFSFEFIASSTKLTFFSLNQNSIEKLNQIPDSLIRSTWKGIDLRNNKCLNEDFPKTSINRLNKAIVQNCSKP